MIKNSWTDEDTYKLRKLWFSDKDIPSIVKELGVFTYSSVTAKAHRLGLPAKKDAVTLKPPAVKKAKFVRTCVWPIGHPNEPGFHFCGSVHVVEGKPYCSDHCMVAYVQDRDEET